MKEQEFIEYLDHDLNIKINDDILKKLRLFSNLLVEYNKHTNITAIKDIDGIYLKHFYDSLTLIQVYDLNQNVEVLDIGSGGGFPGIVLAIVYPNLTITLLDSNNKKCKFQEYIVKKLSLKNVTIVNDRAENYFKLGNKYDLVVARAVAELNILAELCIPFVRKNGYFIAMKGNLVNELVNAEHAINHLGGFIETKNYFNLPISGDNRCLVKISKIKDSPQKFPRRYEKILKKPL